MINKGRASVVLECQHGHDMFTNAMLFANSSAHTYQTVSEDFRSEIRDVIGLVVAFELNAAELSHDFALIERIPQALEHIKVSTTKSEVG